MTINKLKPEMIVYDVRKQTGLPGMFRKWGSYNVVIKEIDYENRRVLASWSGNEPEWFHEYVWKKWRLKVPNE